MCENGIKISIITVCYNSEKYIENCILSVKNQTYDDIEHIIIDGGSKDNTLNIIRKYENSYNLRWISEPDNGMYDAIKKGFSMASGNVYAWLNSDDMYMPWACDAVSKIMKNSAIKWCIGIPCIFNEEGMAHAVPKVCPVYPRKLIAKGYMDGRVHPFMQQESMFWRKELWDEYGATLNGYKSAGDFHLWKHFAQSADLILVDTILAGFRIHPGQKSENRDEYYSEIDKLTIGRKFLSHMRIIPLYCKIRSLFPTQLRVKLKSFVK